MAAYFLTSQALQDLEEIYDFIADDNSKAALRLIKLFERNCKSIAKTPAIGRRRDELAPGLRSLSIRKYIIFYRYNKSRVEIIRIMHGARDISSFFDQN